MRTALVCGARSGRFPLEIRARDPSLALTVHAYDCHQARKIREDLDAAGAGDVETICSSRLPDGRSWDRAFFFRDRKLMSAEFQLDCLQDILAHVPGGERARVEGVDRAEIRQVLKRVRDFSSTWEASVPGGERHAFTTLPGCFCHRRADAGGLALAETAVRLVAEGKAAASAAPVLLDMGCGCGFVGMLVADALRARGAAPVLTAVDSHTRALAATEINAARLGLCVKTLLSDVGTPSAGDGTYDLFLGNPPYYGDWKIAELFLATAARALRPGGVCLTVAKDARGLADVQRRFFDNLEILSRRGYAVLKSVR